MVAQAVVWQQGRYILSKNHGQAVSTSYSPLCHPFQHCHMNNLRTLHKRNGL